MNSERYCVILNEKVVPYFQRRKDIFFQQDGAAPHYSIRAREILNRKMPQNWIGRRGHIEWPARSPDLPPCDFLIWADGRSRVYSPAGKQLDSIPLDKFRNAFRDFEIRCDQCVQNDGNLFEEQ